MEDRYLSKAKRISDGEWVVGGLVRYGFAGKENIILCLIMHRTYML